LSLSNPCLCCCYVIALRETCWWNSFYHFHFSFLGTLSLCDNSPTFKVSLVLSSALGYSVFHLSHEKLQHLHFLQFRTLFFVPWGTQETWECIGNVSLLFDCLLLCLCMLYVCLCLCLHIYAHIRLSENCEPLCFWCICDSVKGRVKTQFRVTTSSRDQGRRHRAHHHAQ
jgi:hypothetical protein